MVIEATGGMRRALAAALWVAEIKVAVINPAWIRNFTRGAGQFAETDKIDTQVLAILRSESGRRSRPGPIWKPARRRN